MADQAPLSSKRVAILVEEDFEDRELPQLIDLLRSTGHHVTIVGPVADAEYRGKRLEATVRSEASASKVKIGDFDIVWPWLLPVAPFLARQNSVRRPRRCGNRVGLRAFARSDFRLV